MREADREFVAHLAVRARRALDDAERIVSEAELLTSAGRMARERDSMVTRCAWCGRLLLGGQWTRVDVAPAFFRNFVQRRVTHGICPDCMRGLEISGKTRPLQG